MNEFHEKYHGEIVELMVDLTTTRSALEDDLGNMREHQGERQVDIKNLEVLTELLAEAGENLDTARKACE